MSISVPTNCSNPECRQSDVRQIHCSSQSVAIDAVDGPSVFAHHVTYRCSKCGHTWAVQGFSSDERIEPVKVTGLSPRPNPVRGRGW